MRPREQLAEHGLSAEDWGGDTLFVDVSAVKGDGIDKLLDAILLQTELLELKANPDRRAMGNVIESGMEQGGPTATVLVRKGTLHVGDTVIGGDHEHNQVGYIGSSCAHGAEGRVPGRVQKGNGFEAFLILGVGHLDGVCTDVLSDASGFARNHVGFADGIQQGGFAVVHVAHHGDDRRT